LGIQILQFLHDNLDYIFFVYGLFFILIGVIALLLHLRKSSTTPWLWLSLFGFAHGITPWASLFAMNFGQETAAGYAVSAVMIFSLAALLEFGRRINGYSYRFVYATIALLIVFLVPQNLFPAPIVLYSLIGFWAILFSATALSKLATLLPCKNLKRAAIFMAIYLIGSVLFAAKSGTLTYLPTIRLDSQFLFIQAAGLLAGFILFSSLWLYYIRYEENSEKLPFITLRTALYPLWSLPAILVLGLYFIDLLGIHRETLLANELLTRTTVAAKSLDRDKIKHLTAEESDIGKPGYEEIKKTLMSIKVKSRFLYLIALRGEEVVIMVDSEPVDSPDYSPAGQQYSEVEQKFVAKLQQNQPFIYGPYRDRWGTWTTAVIPLKLSSGSHLPIYFCSDVDASVWLLELRHARLSGIAIVLLFCILVFYFYLMTIKILQVNTKLGEELGLFVGGPSFVMKWKFSGENLRILYISPNMTLHLGYDTDIFTLRNVSFLGLIHPDESAAFLEALDEIGKKLNTHVELELRLLDREGRYRWFHAFILSKNHTYTLSYHGYFTDISSKKEVQFALEASRKKIEENEERFRSLVENISDWIWEIDPDGVYTYVSPRAKEVLGYEPEEVVGKTPFAFMPQDEAARLIKGFSVIANARRPFSGLINQNLHKDGRTVILETSGVPIIDGNGIFLGYRGFDRDITEKMSAEAALRKITDRLMLHFQQVPFAVIEWDTEFRVVDWNPAAERIFGYTKSEVIGKNAEFLLPANERGLSSKVWADLVATKEGNRSTNENQTKDGRIISCEWYNTPLVDENGEMIGIASVASDVTEKKLFEQKLEYLAYYDELTGLPNRTLFKDRLEIENRRANRNNTITGIVFMDIDFFKTVNDTLGHGVGDILLQAVASRLKMSFRANDTVSRFGGDEFAVLIPDLHHVEEIETILRNIYDKFTSPFEIFDHVIYVTLSIGYSFYPADETDPDLLLRNADAAMYNAKESGRNTYRRYYPEMTAYIQSQLTLQNGLIAALQNGEFLLYYQPQLNIESGMITGVEALIRWNHPERGIVSPVEFIPVAEKTGLIVPMGEWILRTAFQQLNSWYSQGLPPLTMAVNLSSRQFKEENFPNKVIKILNETGVDPNSIELELTESILLEDTAKVLKILTDFKREGFQLSLDDFGTGYSSLSYLKLFPIDKLKIDQSFIKNMTTGGSDINLVKAIIAMGKALDLTTIAEGVELQEQFDFLGQEGCDEIQGYLVGKPMCASELEAFLNERKRNGV